MNMTNLAHVVIHTSSSRQVVELDLSYPRRSGLRLHDAHEDGRHKRSIDEKNLADDHGLTPGHGHTRQGDGSMELREGSGPEVGSGQASRAHPGGGR